MKPVVLLVGKLRNVIGDVPKHMEDLPVRWLGAHDHAEVMRQLEGEPAIASSSAAAWRTACAATLWA